MAGEIARTPPQSSTVQTRPKLDYTDKDLTIVDVLVAPSTDPLNCGMPMGILGTTMGMGMPIPVKTSIKSVITQPDRPDFKQTIDYEHSRNMKATYQDAMDPKNPVPVSTARSTMGTHHHHITTADQYFVGASSPGKLSMAGHGEAHEGTFKREMVPAADGFGTDVLTTTDIGPYQLRYFMHSTAPQLEPGEKPFQMPTFDPSKPFTGTMDPKDMPKYPKMFSVTTYKGTIEDKRTGEKTPMELAITAHMDPSNPANTTGELKGKVGDLEISGQSRMDPGHNRMIIERDLGDYHVHTTVTNEFAPPPPGFGNMFGSPPPG